MNEKEYYSWCIHTSAAAFSLQKNELLLLFLSLAIPFYSGYQSHAPSNDFFQKVRFGGRQSHLSMTIMASAVTRTTISMSILRVSGLLFYLYLTRP